MTQNSLNPADHLTTIRTKDGTIEKIPASSMAALPGALPNPRPGAEIRDYRAGSCADLRDCEGLGVVATDYASATLKCSR